MHFLAPFHMALRALPPELAHGAVLAVLQRLPAGMPQQDDPRLEVRHLGLRFSNPVGMAAGFDKNARVAGQLLGLGFGFIEVGGVTPLPQTGNPTPRLFRLGVDGALINRLGFNNEGLQAVRIRLARLKTNDVIGVNLGANKDSKDRIGDYLTLLEGFDGLADFVALNVSSPNTPGLRGLQDKEQLDTLLQRIAAKREKIVSRKTNRLPVLIKIAPDLELTAIDDICSLTLRYGLDGMIVSNTTLSRPPFLRHAAKNEGGGLSGRPLFELSTRRLAQVRQRVGKEMVLIGVGGIDSGEAAWMKICAGANLVQLYTALVYKGLPLIEEIKTTLAKKLSEKGYASLQQAVGCETAAFAKEPS